MRQDDNSHSFSAVHIYLLYVPNQGAVHGYCIFTEKMLPGPEQWDWVGLRTFHSKKTTETQNKELYWRV